MNKPSLHQRYMSDYEYKMNLARYKTETRELGSRYITEEERHESERKRLQKEREEQSYQRDLERVLQRCKPRSNV